MFTTSLTAVTKKSDKKNPSWIFLIDATKLRLKFVSKVAVHGDEKKIFPGFSYSDLRYLSVALKPSE